LAIACSLVARADLAPPTRAARANATDRADRADRILARATIEGAAGKWSVALSGHRSEPADDDPAPAWSFTLRWRGPAGQTGTLAFADGWTSDEKHFGPLLAPFDVAGRQLLLVRIPGMVIGSEGSLALRLYDLAGGGQLVKRLDSDVEVFDGGACAIRSQVGIERQGDVVRLHVVRENRNPHAHPSGCATIQSSDIVREYRLQGECFVAYDHQACD
jgi:hypothetical protein